MPGTGQTRPDSMPADREVDVLRRAFAQILQRLPEGWKAKMDEEVELKGGRRADALITLGSPDGTKGKLLVEAKRLLGPRDVSPVVDQLRQAYAFTSAEEVEPLVVARYLSPSTREQLESLGASYADATGNLYFSLRSPSLFLRDRGADNDPWRGPGRPRGTLKGEPAGRVVRALVDFAPPFTARRIVELSGASTGAVYRVLDFLDREALIRREDRGRIVEVQWRRIVLRWSEDYGFQTTNPVTTYLEPRGVPALLDALRGSDSLEYTITGSLAAARFAPYAPARAAMLYVDDPAAAAKDLRLRTVDSGANVLLAAAEYNFVFDRTVEAEGLSWAAPSQTAVDLLTGPGRNPSEAEALLDWMEANEREWRR